jgi:ABC-2 type transport system permease protein
MIGAYRTAVTCEILKARRSTILPLTFAAMGLPAGVVALFMFILADPARGRRFGLLGGKAELSGITADWNGLLTFLAQIIAVGCLFVFTFITTWVFGHEYTSGTHRHLLVSPVPRATTVLAKFTLTTGWAIGVTLWLTALVLATGWALDLPGADTQALGQGLADTATAATLMLLVTTPAAFITSATRSFLPSLAAAAAVIVLGQVAAVLGYAHLFPWAIPAAATGLARTPLNGASLAIAAVTGLAGVLGTVRWWTGPNADR